MALIQPPLLTHGGTHSARAFRMMIRDLAAGSEGVTEGGDLKVAQLATPGAGVRISDGSAVIRGAAWAQGSYTQYNVGWATVPVAPTGASERSDLVVLRVEDPEYEGTLDPESDDIGYFHIVPNVSPTARTVPTGMTAIPLARIDIPANTSVITNAMITDLRQVANPRRDRRLYSAYPSSLHYFSGPAETWVDWPTAARWNVPVPAWATRAILTVTVAGLRQSDGNIFHTMQTVFGERPGQDTIIDDNQGDTVRRSTEMIADTFSLPAASRGTTQPLFLQTRLNSASHSGRLSVNGGTSIIADIEFTESVI